jgi:pilus assembly protein Flp/PilA
MRTFLRIIKDQRGATAIEYGLILAMVFLAMIIGVVSVGSANSGMWNYVSQQVTGS